MNTARDGLGYVVRRDSLYDGMRRQRRNDCGKGRQAAQQCAAAIGGRRQHQSGTQDHPGKRGSAERLVCGQLCATERALPPIDAHGGYLHEAGHANGKTRGCQLGDGGFVHGRKVVAWAVLQSAGAVHHGIGAGQDGFPAFGAGGAQIGPDPVQCWKTPLRRGKVAPNADDLVTVAH